MLEKSRMEDVYYMNTELGCFEFRLCGKDCRINASNLIIGVLQWVVVVEGKLIIFYYGDITWSRSVSSIPRCHLGRSVLHEKGLTAKLLSAADAVVDQPEKEKEFFLYCTVKRSFRNSKKKRQWNDCLGMRTCANTTTFRRILFLPYLWPFLSTYLLRGMWNDFIHYCQICPSTLEPRLPNLSDIVWVRLLLRYVRWVLDDHVFSLPQNSEIILWLKPVMTSECQLTHYMRSRI